MFDREIIRLEADLLVIGGGTAGCIAAIEAKEIDPDLKVIILEKAHIERSGCLAPGVNAIYSYLHEGEDPEDFVRWTRYQAMGLLREDLSLSMIKITPYVVKKLEKWGLPIERDENGGYVRQGRWGVRIKGESIKPILARRVRKSKIDVLNRVYTTNFLIKDDRVLGAMGFGVRDGKFYVIKAKATIVATGGASGIYKPYSLMWYPPYNAGSGYAMGIRAGAEMTSFEMRFCPIRIKDVNSPIGITAVGFNAPLINAWGEEFMKERYSHLGGETAPISIRVHGPMNEILEGRGPCYIDTRGLNEIQAKKLKELYLNAWPAFILFLYGNKIDLKKEPLEIHGTEPYITGSHCEAGYWIDNKRATTLKGLFAAGDCAGGVSLKHVGGALAEGVIASRSAIDYMRKSNDIELDESQIESEMERVFAPLKRWKEKNDGIFPEEMEKRLQKVMDEYAGGLSRFYQMTEKTLKNALKEVSELKNQEKNLVSRDLHELMRAHEVLDRLEIAWVLIHHLLFRKETRWPAFQSRKDYPKRDDSNWLVFVNSRKNLESGSIELFKRKYKQIVSGERYKP